MIRNTVESGALHDPATAVADLKSTVNKTFGRKFSLVSLRQLIVNKDGNPT